MEKERLYADSELVEWLLFRSGLNKSSIAIGSGLAFSTVSDLKDSVSTIEGARFKSVAKLTSFAKTLQKDSIKVNVDSQKGLTELLHDTKNDRKEGR